jgi:hypothetical protein
MNKRIYLILLPILAILFSITGRTNNPLFATQTVHGSKISRVVIQNDFPASPDLTKNNRSRIRTAIRIKAWDDAVAINITPAPGIVFHHFLSPSIIYGGYRVNELSAHFSTSGLRGPPVVL